MNNKIRYTFLFTIGTIIISLNCFGQPSHYTTANAHSHNDYEQMTPFFKAYKKGFGSIETDIHLVNGNLLVGHETNDLNPEKTLEHLYLIPLKKIHDSKRKLLLLIDIKTEALTTLNALIKLLHKFPKIIHSPYIKIVISGNRPDPKKYHEYPKFIWFDGRFEQEYSKEALNKIALLSEDFSKLAGNSESLPISDATFFRLKSAIDKGHALKKPTRLWASPDYPEGWNLLMNLGVDYINTDHIEDLGKYLERKSKLK